MPSLLQKIPFLLEFFINGSFIIFMSMKTFNRLPGNWEGETINQILTYGSSIIPLVLFIKVLAGFLTSKSIEDYIRRDIFSLICFIPLLITWGDLDFAYWFSSAHLLFSILSIYDEEAEEKRISGKGDLFQTLSLKPAQWVMLTFLVVVLLGTFLLMLPVSAAKGKVIGFVDAFFTATSATCVTGLGTRSLSTDFSMIGQLVCLILIQIGGLSIMTLYSVVTILLGKSMGMNYRVIMQDLLDVSSMEDLFTMVVDIVKYTFLIELWGAIVLTIAFTFEGFDFGQAMYYGFFHSISAFCNAGFSLFDTSLETYATNPLINFTIMTLVTLGGLGFIVLRELKEVVTKKRTKERLGLHTKIVLYTSAVLTLSGTIFIFFGEYLGSLDQYSLFDKFQISLFQSVTLRTAGFNTLPLTNLNTYTLYFMTLFMFIGGSPGSTAGGIKTTTLAILAESIIATLKGKKSVTIFRRKVPGPMVVRATALTFISILFTSFFILVLMKLEPEQNFLAIFFEVLSASGTVGLTLGITPFLSMAGKIALSILMFIGRIGPLTLIIAIGQQQKARGKFDYPDGRIMIG